MAASRKKKSLSVSSWSVTETTCTVELDKSHILEAVKLLGVQVPPDAYDVKVFLRVPGGGDWSNTDLEVCKADPLMVTWKEHCET